jgi:hypothetical protein
MRSFESTIVADCPFSAAQEYVSSYMRRFAAGADDLATVRIPVKTFGLPIPGSIPHRVRMTFEETIDENERNRSHRGLTFHWDAGNPLLPDLHGDLSFRIAPDSCTELVLTGRYTPPLGAAGSLLDKILGKRIALATGQALLERISADMEWQERDFRSLHATV